MDSNSQSKITDAAKGLIAACLLFPLISSCLVGCIGLQEKQPVGFGVNAGTPCSYALSISARGATNRVIQSIGETKYWMPDAAKLPDASILFGSDMQREVKAFGNMKNKLKPLVKKWAAVYLNQIKDTRPRTLYVGPFAENVLPVVIYDYEGASFWEVGNVKSFEDPVALPPGLVTKIHTFDFLLAGTSDANSRAAQQFLIKWQVANCVIDGMRVEVTSDDIAKAQRH